YGRLDDQERNRYSFRSPPGGCQDGTGTKEELSTEGTAVESFNITYLRDTDKLIEFRLVPLDLPDIKAAPTDIPINVTPPTIERIRMTIIQIESGKAAEPDNIPAEALNSDRSHCTDAPHSIQEDLEEEQVLIDWKEEYLIKEEKKGDLDKYGNHRCITLLSAPEKIVLLNWMNDSVDAQLRDPQVVFRKGWSCTDQIATLRIIVEQSIQWNSSLYINFMDYEKAFNSVDRRTL
ncbi:unnamed protein product, partial [Schistosoma curassoni]|uniref:Reverse transcriptase domain-containing protein n=1 Tax=Schistosoma curassoni TaxID=6186 RepID=A0A183JR75_9TREM